MGKKHKSVVAYNSIRDKEIDELNEELWNFCFSTGWKLTKWFMIVSTPVFVISAAVAPYGTDRLNFGKEMVARQHQFLWTYLGLGIAKTGEALEAVLVPLIDNGSSDHE